MVGVHLKSSSPVDFQRAAGDSTSPATSLPWLVESLEWVALIWYLFIVLVCTLGYFQIWRYYSSKPPKSFSSSSPDAPHVTVIRPVKGVEPYLYECLASTLRQEYPLDKLTTYICVSSREDPSFPILERVIADFPEADAQIFVEEEDPLLQDGSGYSLGPNPKIRNMSRAYREAKGDIVWIIDCNVWVGKGVCGRMVDKLCGSGSNKGTKYKFVHHLPLVVNVDPDDAVAAEARPLLTNGNATRSSSHVTEEGAIPSLLREGGGRLEELFLSSSHAKMYTAISTVAIAPCIVGKSNMFRRSHLNYLTTPSSDDPHPRNPGIDYVSEHLCEDHIIGDWLWKNEVREERELGERLGKHALVFGDFAFQPVANMSVNAYIARRVRWLRVRKFTVLAATLVEPGTESIVCSLYGAIGLTTVVARLLQARGNVLGSYLQTWSAFLAVWFLSIILWVTVDWTLYLRLHFATTVEVDEHTAPFTRPPTGRMARRPFLHWLAAWIGRETLAFPIWFWAVFGGSTVVWRNRKYRVSMMDTKAREVMPSASERRSMSGDSSYSNGAISPSSSSSSPGQRGECGKIRRD